MFRERMRGKRDQKYCPIVINLCTAVGEGRVMLSARKHRGPRVRSFATLRMTILKIVQVDVNWGTKSSVQSIMAINTGRGIS
jgi:hypothetical protein